MVEIAVLRQGGAWPDEAALDPLIERATAAAVAVSERKPRVDAELSVVLGDDVLMRTLNRDWRDKDKPTNVLSFPAVPASRIAKAAMLGDVVLAYETVAAEAAEAARSLVDHVAHLVVHGVLHCLGYDHETDAEATDMEARETRALAGLGIADPYAEPAAPADAARA